ncbi:hypothetical protein [Lacipirellula parvula]|uniref:hypothetical protein n=1 Tax=Lacipirellula parvula TaxID=2650471 RepID=UPI001260C4FE|nr:hypothetical protein [Lacipirellula parvula]
MRILFDQGTPVPLRHALPEHQIETAFERGWSTLQNGDLLNAAEQEGFDLLITTDQSLKYQQNLPARKIAIVVIKSANWRLIQTRLDAVREACQAISAGGYVEVEI